MKTKIDYEKIMQEVAADIDFDLYVNDLSSVDHSQEVPHMLGKEVARWDFPEP